MESRNKHHDNCDCCHDSQALERVARRDFLATAGGAVLGASALGGVLPAARIWAKPAAAATPAATAANAVPESLVKTLYETLSPKQRETICFDWDHKDPKLGLLRTRISANWNITEPFVVDRDFYTNDQMAIIRSIFEGIISPEWHERIDKQLEDDAGGYGEQQSIAIFGKPGEKFEFVMTGRHMTLRCDGNSSENVAFGGPKLDQLFVTGGLGPEAGPGGLFRLDLGVPGLKVLPSASK